MEGHYRKLIEACTNYMERTPKTQHGQERKTLVSKIQNQAIQDFVGLLSIQTDFHSMPLEKLKGKTGSQLLEGIRTVHLSVKNFSELEKTDGGQASEIYKLKSSDVKVKNTSGT